MLIQVTSQLLEGFAVTFELFALTLLFSLPLGLIISFGSMSRFKAVNLPIKLIVWIIRGTPLMLQLMVIYYGPGLAVNWAESAGVENFIIDIMAWLNKMEPIVAALIAFVINYACYFSEIFRGGIQSIPRGQYEACQVLGMTRTQAFFKVVLLQVVKRIVPPMSNEIITLVKDTSLARIITVYEVIFQAERFIKSEGLIWPLFYTAVFYLIFCGVLTLLFRHIEKKLDYFRA